MCQYNIIHSNNRALLACLKMIRVQMFVTDCTGICIRYIMKIGFEREALVQK